MIQSIMSQAILYGANEDVMILSLSTVALAYFFQNPFLFSFPLEVEEESLSLGAEQLTEAVLASGNHKRLRNTNLVLIVYHFLQISLS